LVEGLKYSNSVACSALVGLTYEIEDIYAFKKPNVLNRPHEQPITESQPARPPSGAMGSVFSDASVTSSSGKAASSISEGMIRTVQKERLRRNSIISVLVVQIS
jgi:hypothetical protein